VFVEGASRESLEEGSSKTVVEIESCLFTIAVKSEECNCLLFTHVQESLFQLMFVHDKAPVTRRRRRTTSIKTKMATSDVLFI
jgi:hypothetical protein